MPRRSGMCLFGGAFDPPHATHRRLAETAAERLAVVEVRVLPAGDHPHRPRLAAPAADRLAMCELAFAGLPRVVVDDRELRRAGPSFSIDTVRSVRAELGEGPPIYWLIGSDNLPKLPTWHDHHALLEEATVVTFPRAGHPCAPHVLEGLDLTAAERHALLAHCLDLPPDAVNATAIRAALARGERPPEIERAVFDHITGRGLYR